MNLLVNKALDWFHRWGFLTLLVAGLAIAACSCASQAVRTDAPPRAARAVPEVVQDGVKEEASGWVWCYVFMNGC